MASRVYILVSGILVAHFLMINPYSFAEDNMFSVEKFFKQQSKNVDIFRMFDDGGAPLGPADKTGLNYEEAQKAFESYGIKNMDISLSGMTGSFKSSPAVTKCAEFLKKSLEKFFGGKDSAESSRIVMFFNELTEKLRNMFGQYINKRLQPAPKMKRAISEGRDNRREERRPK